jgi:sugar-phosphatase
MSGPGLEVAAAAVVFDMDGTIVDSTAAVEYVWGELARDWGIDLDDLLAYAHGRQSLDTIKHFIPAGGDPQAAAAWLDAEELVRMEGVVEIPGAARLLAQIPPERTAVVTSASDELARRRMRAAGLEPPGVLVSADDVSAGKPSPEGFLTAAARLGVAPEECLVFEDAEAGIRAGLAAGAHVVVVGGNAPTSSATSGLPRIEDFTRVEVSHRGGTLQLRQR